MALFLKICFGEICMLNIVSEGSEVRVVKIGNHHLNVVGNGLYGSGSVSPSLALAPRPPVW